MDRNNNSSNGVPTGVHVGSPSSAERTAKRRRRSPCNDDVMVDENYDDANSKPLALPPEVWADVMKFLPFDMVITCGAVSRSMLHDTMPLLTEVKIDKASQMHHAVARRFRDITDIHINSLLRQEIDDEGMPDIFIDSETKMRVVPFLSRFGALERVYFGGKNNDNGEDVEGFSSADGYYYDEADLGYPFLCAWDEMMGVIDNISAAFDTGAFSKNLQIFGLCCPGCTRATGTECGTCKRACKSFPLESVAEFESKGSSVSNARSGRTHGLDVCLPMAQVESIIESRPRGKELLRSDSRLLRLLGRGRRWKLNSDDSKGVLLIVKYSSDQLEEMKRVVQYAELNVKKLSTQKLQEAILNSFGNGRSIAPNCQRYLSQASLTYLKDEVGIETDTVRKLFDCNVSSMLEWVKPIADILIRYFDLDAPLSNDNTEIISDCIKLSRQFLELESGVPIHHLARAIPTLAQLLVYEGYEHYRQNIEDKVEVVKSLNLFLTKGTQMHMRMIVNAGAVSKFCALLEGWNGHKNIVQDVLLGLANIVDQDRHLAPTIVEKGAIPKLITLLESSVNK